VTTLVGGVGELFQGDLDLGRLAAERLQDEARPARIMVEELHYGAVAVVQRIQELRADSMILVGAVRGDRPPGSVLRRLVAPVSLSAGEMQAAVGDAVTGYVGIELIIEVAAGLGALPARTVVVQVEPEHVGPGEGLTATATAGLERAVELVRTEIRRTPLLDLAEVIRVPDPGSTPLGPSRAVTTMTALLAELRLLEEEARWGRSFALRDQLRLAIAAGDTSESMTHRDWGLWWSLIEELDRLEADESIDR